MTRWLIEKSGTGIEKSGTGIEKSGTGIEKSGTGIEKSGTGIEKSGTGIRKSLLAIGLAACAFSSHVSAFESLSPAGNLQIVADQHSGTLAVSWIIDGSVFSGAASLQGSFTSLPLTEIAIARAGSLDVVGGGTGKEVVGGGTGAEVVGGGTGSSTLVVGGGTGSEAVSITLPQGTGMHMEIAMSCTSATVSVLDASYGEVVTFNNVPVIGNTGLCSSGGAGGSFSRFAPSMR